MNIVFDISNALESLYPEGANYIQEGFNYSGLTWLDKIKSQPTEAEIDAEVIRLQAEYDALQYQRDRQYPPIGDQLDYIYHNGVAKWKTDMIDPVKTKYPKA